MVKLIPNANAYVKNQLQEKSTKAYYLAMREAIEKHHETLFASEMQSYVTRLGLIVANCYEAHLRANTYLGSIEYLCKVVIKDNTLHELLRAIGVNDNSNNGKHTLKNVDIDIKECLHQYNTLIKKLVAKTHLDSFNMCYLTFKKKESVRDVSLFDDKKHHIFGSVTGFDYQIKMTPNYDLDPYKKKVKTKITVYWPKGHADKLLDITIVNTVTKKQVLSKKNISVSDDNSKVACPLTLSETDLDRRVLKLEVKLRLHKQEEHSYETGFIFKKLHTYTDDKEIGVKTEIVSQIYRPKND